MIGVGVVGFGYWGPNVLRVLSGFDDCAVRVVCDLDPERLAIVRRQYPALRLTTDLADVIGDPSVDVVTICTPVGLHHDQAAAALRARKHVIVEKPLTDSVRRGEALVELAAAGGVTLQVDHTFVYSGAVRKIRELIDEGGVGDLLYLDSVRVNLGLFQWDASVLWDLAPHDVSIITYLVDKTPRWVSAVGCTHYGEVENQVYLTLGFDDSFIAHVHVNWLAPVKLRSTLIGGSKRMIVYDDLEPSEKIRVYEKGVTVSDDATSRAKALVDYRVGDMFAPYIDKTEPLARAYRSFLDAIVHGTPSVTDGSAGLAVVRILEAAERSLRAEGRRVPLREPA